MFKSNLKFYLKETITVSAVATDTFEISEDLELGGVIDTAGEQVSMVLKNSTQIERFIITVSSGTATIVKRGLTQDNTETESTSLNKQWSDGDIGYITALAYDFFDKDGDNTLTGDNTYSGANTFTGNNTFEGTDTINNIVLSGDTTTAGLTLKSLTTAQRDALTPAEGMIIKNSTTGVLNQYVGGIWTDFASGSVVNASETVAGKVEIATNAEMGAGTGTGGTGAILVVTSGQLVKTSAGAGDENKVGVLNASGLYDDLVSPGSETTAGLVEVATHAEALSGTSTSTVVTPDGLGIVIDHTKTTKTHSNLTRPSTTSSATFTVNSKCVGEFTSVTSGTLNITFTNSIQAEIATVWTNVMTFSSAATNASQYGIYTLQPNVNYRLTSVVGGDSGVASINNLALKYQEVQ